MTAYADLDAAIQAIRAGASDFIPKPFRPTRILNAVARCPDRAGQRRENLVLRHELGANVDRLAPGGRPAAPAGRLDDARKDRRPVPLTCYTS